MDQLSWIDNDGPRIVTLLQRLRFIRMLFSFINLLLMFSSCSKFPDFAVLKEAHHCYIFLMLLFRPHFSLM